MVRIQLVNGLTQVVCAQRTHVASIPIQVYAPKMANAIGTPKIVRVMLARPTRQIKSARTERTASGTH